MTEVVKITREQILHLFRGNQVHFRIGKKLDTQVTLELMDEPTWTSPDIEVVYIHAEAGDDGTGEGTPNNPFKTTRRAKAYADVRLYDKVVHIRYDSALMAARKPLPAPWKGEI
jgi:hypothetical protein